MNHDATQNEELEVTWSHVISVWWLVMSEAAPLGGVIIGSIIGLVWGVVVMRMALRKTYKGFRLALIPVS